MKQVNISQQRKDLDYTDSQKKVLELEKKYMTRLKEIFTGINFNNNMKNCIDLTKNIIIQESSMGTWGKTNPIEISKSKGVTNPNARNLLLNNALDNFFLSGIPSQDSICLLLLLLDACIYIPIKI